MSIYVKIYLKCNNGINDFDFGFYFCKKTTFEDLLEYIIYNFQEKKICTCFQFKTDKSKLISLETNFNNYYNENKISGYLYYYINIYIFNPNEQCNCKQNIKDNITKSKMAIIKELNTYKSNLIQGEDKEKKKGKENTIQSLLNENQTLKKMIQDLENEKKENNQKMSDIQKNNDEKENLINELKSKEEDKNKEYNEVINKLNKDKQLLEIAINGDITKINELKNLGVTGEYLKPKENIIKIDPETNKIISKEILNKDIIFVDFYDVIIDINSIKDINKGWKIKMSERAKENYQLLKKEKIIKIGVIGNSNKGKSFILSKLSKIELPSGTSIRTEGLSIKYPDLDIYTNRKIVLLDSAGLETPVLKNKNDIKEKKEKKDNIEIKAKEANEDLIEEEDFEIDDKSEKELFKEKSREKLITELFLQNYIIYNSNILLIVVGILTYSEQKLINRIQTEIQRTKINRKLFVIHNLLTYTTKEQIKEYIETYLLKSTTFNLEEGHKINSLKKEENGIYLFEKNSEPRIYHLIFANEGSEAGEYYNNFTLNFIENQYADVIDLKSFDVIETVKDKFIEISKEILEKIENPFQKTDFDDSDKNFIKLKNIKNIQLKKCLIDELGFSNLKTNSFEPNYNCYKKDDKIIIRVEVPGNCNIKTKTEHSGEYTLLRIEGTKRKDKEPEKPEENLYNSREFGSFSFNVPLKTDEYLIKNEPPKVEDKKGLIIIQFQLDEKKTEIDFGDNLNDSV